MEKETIASGYVLALLLAVIILAPCVVPALASVTYLDHGNAGGNAVIDISEHQPPIRLRILHYDWCTNVIGAADELTISLKFGSSWIPVAAMVDNPSQVEWEEEVFAGMPIANNIMLVAHCELQVHKVGKTAVFAYWTEPQIVSITGDSPWGLPWSVIFGVSSVTLPPGSLLIEGAGEELTKTSYTPPGGSGYAINTDWKYYLAQATFECPTWNYYGPVGSTTTPSTMIKDITFAATK